MAMGTREIAAVASLTLCVCFGARAGEIAFISFRDGLPNLYLMNEDGSNIHRVLDSPDGIFGPAWSPDGETIAVAVSDTLSLFRVHEGMRTDLALPGTINKLPSWSRDGQHIAFYAFAGGIVNGVYLADNDGGGAKLLSPGFQTRTSWLAGGESLAMARDRGLGGLAADIFRVDVRGGRTNLTEDDAWNYAPSVSPDGTRIAFESNRDAGDDPLHTQVYVMDVDGGRRRLLGETEGEAWVTGWTYPEQGVLYSELRAGDRDIWTVSRDGVSTRRLTQHPAWDIDAVMKPGPLVVNPLNLKASVWGFMKRAAVDR